VLTKGQQFLLRKRHPSCYSYASKSPVIKVFSVIEERKTKSTLKGKDPFHLRYAYVNVCGRMIFQVMF